VRPEGANQDSPAKNLQWVWCTSGFGGSYKGVGCARDRTDGERKAFEEFFRRSEGPMRAAFVALYGPDIGRDATAEALTEAWDDWPRVASMANPLGYLFRVGQSRVRPLRRPPVFSPAPLPVEPQSVDPGLSVALTLLTEQQRVAVVLAHGYGFAHAQVAQLMGLRRSTVQNHVERGLVKLRAALEVHCDQ
jgi:DNA-directed RNA polymerase specialized sigma24 family protein